MEVEDIRYSFMLCTIVILVAIFSLCLLGYIPFLTNKYINNNLPDYTWPRFQQHFETTVDLVKAMTTVISKVYIFYQKWKEHQREMNEHQQEMMEENITRVNVD